MLDVRSVREYQSGHVPGSHNIPLKSIEDVAAVVENKDAKLYVYCQSGARSKQAVDALSNMGYSNVKNIGGIAAYNGEIENNAPNKKRIYVEKKVFFISNYIIIFYSKNVIIRRGSRQ